MVPGGRYGFGAEEDAAAGDALADADDDEAADASSVAVFLLGEGPRAGKTPAAAG